MSKRAEEKAREYANTLRPERTAYEDFIAGYEQAEKEYIELAQLWVDSGNVNIMSFKSFLKMWNEKEGNQ